MEPEFFLRLGGLLKWVGAALYPLFLLPLVLLIIPGPLSAISKRLSGILDGITGIVLRIAMAATLALLLLQLAVVVAAFAFGLSWTWLSELVIFAFATMFMLGAAVALRDDAHVRVDILRPRFGENGRNWIELVGLYLFLFPICIRLLSMNEQGLARSWRLFEGSQESDGLPIFFLFKTLLPIFAILMLAQGLSLAIKAALRLGGHMPPATPSEPAGGAHGA